MYPFDGLLKGYTAAVFNPKVTPDPTESERLEAKLREAAERLRNTLTKNYPRRAYDSQPRH